MKFVKYAALAAILAVLSGCGIHTVDTGQRGIKVHFGQVVGEPLPEGLYFVNPFTTTIKEIDTRTLKWDAKTEAYTKDVQESTISFTLNYSLRQSAAGKVFKTVGDDWADKLVGQVVLQSIKDVVGQWDAVDLITNRQKANDQITQLIRVALDQRDIDLPQNGFSLTDISYNDAFNKSVEAKVIAQQKAQEAANHTAEVQQEANQKVINATAEAQSMKIRADALAQNPKLVAWEAVQKWDGKLPVNMYGGAALPFVDVSKDK